MVYNSIDFTNINTLLDVGTGSGIPGIVLKLFFPNIKLTLIDSNRKKCYFLQQLIKKINLNDVEII
jgi:16S rRNA (guanine527-N7)-methyltransferase